MLTELVVENLGVIERARLLLGSGMTALTGETGAGKTLLVEAIELLVGGRTAPALVRPGATEATVEGRFVAPSGEELVLTRVVPVNGRSRAYVDGRAAPTARLSELGSALVDLHGQHAHQSLLRAESQRAALDRFAGVDLAPLRAARAKVAELDAELAELGGDARARARELDLLRYQVDELDRAGLGDPDEDEQLAAEEDRLAGAAAHRSAGELALEALRSDGGAGDGLGNAISALAGRSPFADAEARLRALVAEVTDLTAELRRINDGIEEDPERLAAVGQRRQLLVELRRKYGETVADVMAFHETASRRLAELERYDERAAESDAARAAAMHDVAGRAGEVADARAKAAEPLARAVEARLADLAMPRARVEITVGGEPPGDDVEFLLSANAGSPPRPLTKVASGGELARVMLALRLVLVGDVAPPTLVFDEVDAGVGGAAAAAVGSALAELGQLRQVLVVTHLPQVAAQATAQVAVSKVEDAGQTSVALSVLDGEARVIELSRMLSGFPDSTTARDHAAELLAIRGGHRRSR